MQPENATFRQVVFSAGSAVFEAVKPGDSLFVTHTATAEFGVSLTRDDELVLAFGAVAHVPLGQTVDVVPGPSVESSFEPIKDTWLEVSCGGHTERLRSRQVRRVGAYPVYLEHSWNFGIPGNHAQGSIAIAADESLSIASMRSAILMAASGRRFVQWD